MKKLLTLLGTITLIGTTSTNVVACGSENPIPSTRTDLSKIIKIFDLGNIYVGQLEKPNKKQILQAIINKNSSVNSLTESDFDFDGTPTANETKIKGTGNYKGEISLKFTISNFKCIYTNGLPISSSFPIVNIKENNNIIYVSTSIVGNIYKSTDNGTTFLPMSGINSLIRSLDIDKNGNIYAGNTNGIVYKSNGTDAFTAMTGASGNISSLATDKNGNIYAGSTNGIVYKSNGTDAFTAMTGTSIYISSLATDKNGNIYAGDYNGIVYKSNGTDAFTAMTGTSGNISSLATDKNGNIYAGNTNGIVYKSNGTDAFTAMTGTSIYISSLATDKNGNIYAGNTNGIVYKSNGTDAFTAMTGASGNISSLATDKNGNIYAVGKMDKKLSLFISEKF